MPSILFVCSKNQFRSPIAAALFRDHLAHLGMAEGWFVDSAGTWADDSLPASRLAQEAINELDGSIKDHRSKGVTREFLHEFDLILTMEMGQMEALKIEFPEVGHKVFLLTSMAGPAYNLMEPEEQTLEAYHALIEEISDLITRGIEKIVSLSGKK